MAVIAWPVQLQSGWCFSWKLPIVSWQKLDFSWRRQRLTAMSWEGQLLLLHVLSAVLFVYSLSNSHQSHLPKSDTVCPFACLLAGLLNLWTYAGEIVWRCWSCGLRRNWLGLDSSTVWRNCMEGRKVAQGLITQILLAFWSRIWTQGSWIGYRNFSKIFLNEFLERWAKPQGTVIVDPLYKPDSSTVFSGCLRSVIASRWFVWYKIF